MGVPAYVDGPGIAAERGVSSVGDDAMTGTEVTAPSWQHDAACAQVGGDWWFPEPHSHIPAPVIDICATCPARRSCLIFALSTDVLHGVWAALSPGEVWALRQRVLAGEPVATVIRAGLRLGDARQQDSSTVYYRSAPSNPAASEVARQARTVTERIIAAAADEVDGSDQAEGPTVADLVDVERLLTWPPAA
jgi:WhiB family transcriptional regulator, redox-sensing transcriptional regulator